MTLVQLKTTAQQYFNRSILLLFILFSSKSLFAAQAERGALLQISPRLCISSQAEPECALKIDLTWQYNGTEPICILSDYPALPKYCPDSNEIDSLILEVITQKDIQFILVSRQTNQPLGGVKFKVMPTSEPKVRRRYRNPWSLF